MRYLITLILVGFGALALANETQPRPPWLQDDVLRAAVALELTEEQQPQFRDAVTDLVNNRTKAFNKILRQNNVANLERKLKTASNRQFKKMDKAMGGFLSEAQLTRYDAYRDALQVAFEEAARSRTSTDAASAEAARSGVLGNSFSNQ